MAKPSPDLLSELDAVNSRLEHAAPLGILKWTFERFGDDLAMACSFEDVALLHMVHELRPGTEIIFLDTGGHFPAVAEPALLVRILHHCLLPASVPKQTM